MEFGWYGGDVPWWGWPLLAVALARIGFLARHWREDHAALRLWWAGRRLERQVRRWERT